MNMFPKATNEQYFSNYERKKIISPHRPQNNYFWTLSYLLFIFKLWNKGLFKLKSKGEWVCGIHMADRCFALCAFWILFNKRIFHSFFNLKNVFGLLFFFNFKHHFYGTPRQMFLLFPLSLVEFLSFVNGSYSISEICHSFHDC